LIVSITESLNLDKWRLSFIFGVLFIKSICCQLYSCCKNQGIPSQLSNFTWIINLVRLFVSKVKTFSTTSHAQLHSCHLTSRDALSWVSWLVWIFGCVGSCHELFTSGDWFGASELFPLRLICSLRVSWMMSAVLFSTMVRPSWKRQKK